VRRDIPYKIFSQHGYSSTKYSASRGIYQYKIFSQHGNSSTKYSVRMDIPVQNIQSVGIFQHGKNTFGRTGQDRTGQDRTGQDRTGQDSVVEDQS
jgi:hypothetical protein